MLQLHATLATKWHEEPFVLRLSSDLNRPPPHREREAYLLPSDCSAIPSGFRTCIATSNAALDWNANGIQQRVCRLPSAMAFLADGDILRISPTSGHVAVLYRRNSASNSLLLTERCNSCCIMCSQPPKPGNDDFLVDAYLEAIPLMARDTPALGITGGEPTLLGDRFLQIIETCKVHLPHTALHVLSNGRLFNYLSLCQEVARIEHPDLVIGVPLYSDIASRHDFVVQARGAFDQTIRGLMNLARCDVRLELRIVLHRVTVERLPQFARFVARNLPFVEHIAFMGLENMGFARTNFGALWIDPVDYRQQLASAVRLLALHRLNVSIYNHQLCTIDQELWPFARKSISDWKNEYLEVCSSCDVRGDCGGFFASAGDLHSRNIRPIHFADKAPVSSRL